MKAYPACGDLVPDNTIVLLDLEQRRKLFSDH